MLSDADLTALASAGGNALVGAMATDAWQAARSGIARLFARCGSQRQAAVQAQLDGNATLVERASEPDHARQRLVPAWELELAFLLGEDPRAEAELREFIAHLSDVLPRGQRWVQTNVARDGSRLFAVQGGNIVYHELAEAAPERRDPLPRTGAADGNPDS